MPGELAALEIFVNQQVRNALDNFRIYYKRSCATALVYQLVFSRYKGQFAVITVRIDRRARICELSNSPIYIFRYCRTYFKPYYAR